MIEEFQARLTSQQKSKESLEEEISSLKSSMNTLDNHLQEYEAQRIQAERQINLLNKQLEENRKKNENLTLEIENYENIIDSMKSKHGDIDGEKKILDEKLKKKDEEIRILNETIRDHHFKSERSKGEIESLIRKIGEIESLAKEKQNVLMGSVENLSNENGSLIVKMNKQQTEMNSQVLQKF